LMFKSMPDRQAFQDYVGPFRERAAYKRSKEIDAALMPKGG
jgi:hypothetical protein